LRPALSYLGRDRFGREQEEVIVMLQDDATARTSETQTPSASSTAEYRRL